MYEVLEQKTIENAFKYIFALTIKYLVYEKYYIDMRIKNML